MIRLVTAGLVVALPVVGQQDTVTARRNLTIGNYAEAVAQLEANPGASPQSARDYLMSLAATGRYEHAESEAVRIAAAAPQSEVFTTLGEILLMLGRLDEAQESFETAVRNDAGDALVAEYHLARMQYDRGQVDSALNRFSTFVSVYNNSRSLSSRELEAVASAARYVGTEDQALFQDAVRVYDEAVTADNANLQAWVLLGELFLDKYNSSDAGSVFNDVLEINPRHPGALLGMARSQHFEGNRESMETVDQALEINRRYVPAMVFKAELLIELERYDEADRLLDEALEVNPSSLPAMAIKAAVRDLQGNDTGFRALERRILDANPRYAELYNKLAELAARNRQYARAVTLAERAIRVDSRSWRAYGLLGLNQLRTGAMVPGRRNLEVAFNGDPFNVWIKNTLDLSDTFGEYITSSSEHFEFVLHESEAALLEPYVKEVAEEAFAALSARYGATPPTPIRLEVYPHHADFSVRTVGLAGMGALGVSFGSVLAMDSPAARDRGDFNWASTLWHEIAHAFHLALTEHRVPRWFTEGCAVHEERLSRPGWGWGDDVSPSFLAALRDERLFPVSELNEGFVRPQYPEHIGHSYLQASFVCEYIEDGWGTDALLGMMSAYRSGTPGSEVIARVLDVDAGEFDQTFERHLRGRFDRALEATRDFDPQNRPRMSEQEVGRWAARRTDDFAAQMTAAQTLYRAEQYGAARSYFARARELFPEYAGRDAPAWYMAQIDHIQGRPASAESLLVELTAVNGKHYEALSVLADVRIAQGDTAGASDALQRMMYVYPYDMGAHQRIAEWSEAVEDFPAAVRARQSVVALDPVDMASARYHLARAYLWAGDVSGARREILRTLEQAPNYAEALELLLEIRSRGRP